MIVVVTMEIKKITPPIVGVPAFFIWDLGPSVLILWPNLNRRSIGIINGPNITEIRKDTAKIVIVISIDMLDLPQKLHSESISTIS